MDEDRAPKARREGMGTVQRVGRSAKTSGKKRSARYLTAMLAQTHIFWADPDERVDVLLSARRRQTTHEVEHAIDEIRHRGRVR